MSDGKIEIPTDQEFPKKEDFMKSKLFWGETAISSELAAIAWELKQACDEQAEKIGEWKNLTQEQWTKLQDLINRLEKLRSNTEDYAMEQIWHKAESLKHSFWSWTNEQEVKGLKEIIRNQQHEIEQLRKSTWQRKVKDKLLEWLE